MQHKIIKIALTTLVLVLAFAGLLWSTLSEDAEYYKHVDEVMAAPTLWEGKRLQLHGFVAGPVLRKPNTLDYRFQIQNKGQLVWAEYTGLVPDTFKTDSEVVLKGTLTGDQFHVEPNGVMAKCPSKYEPQAAAPGAARGTSGT
jgi:cytochrome c-type biogenesis protein CcmE